MSKLNAFLRATTLVLGILVLTTPAVHAQEATTPATPASGFDGYRVAAVTAGVIGGVVIATIVTDGLIIPAYAAATGAEVGGMGAMLGLGSGQAAQVGAAAGAEMGGAAAGSSMIAHIGHGSYALFHSGMQLLGAIGGGFFADDWYTSP